MAEEIDLNFLGEQIKRLQADVRDLKARTARTDADVLALGERLEALEQRVDAGFAAVDQRLERVEREISDLKREISDLKREIDVIRMEMREMRSEMARNFEIVLTAIREQRE